MARTYYSAGSNALQPSVDDGGLRRKRRRKVKTKIVRKGLQYRDVGRTQMPFSMYALGTVVLLFAVSLSTVMSYALISDRRAAIRGLEAELLQVREENDLIRAQISERYDINEIERIASTRLMMGRPMPHQVVHIYVPRR